MPDRHDLEHHVALQLHRWVATSGKIAHRYAAQTDLGSSDFNALLHLWESKIAGREVTASQLAAHLDLTPAAVTYLVDRLVKRGFVERVPNPADRRQVLLQVSAHGGKLSHDFMDPLGNWFSRTLESRSDAELESFTEIISDLIAALSTLIDTPENEDNHDA